MSTYAIGDLQGCLDPLLRLLDKINYEPGSDKLWFAGDLVNRGPQSLETLRFVRKLGSNAISVLGNHDLHLLAISTGFHKRSNKDTLETILSAPDKQKLIDWLRRLPLLHHDDDLGYTMVHAGMDANWDLTLAQSLAKEVEARLSSDDYASFLQDMYGNKPAAWKKNLDDIDRARFAINCFTRIRYIQSNGKMEFDYKGPPEGAPKDLTPWFDVKNRNNKKLKLIFGHWSSLGAVTKKGVYPLDRGCVWGGCLAAMELETEQITEISC